MMNIKKQTNMKMTTSQSKLRRCKLKCPMCGPTTRTDETNEPKQETERRQMFAHSRNGCITDQLGLETKWNKSCKDSLSAHSSTFVVLTSSLLTVGGGLIRFLALAAARSFAGGGVGGLGRLFC